MRPLPLAAIKPRSRTPLAKRSRGDQAAAGALGCRAVIREAAPGGTYTSAPRQSATLSTRSAAPPTRLSVTCSAAPPPLDASSGSGTILVPRCFTQRRCWLRLSRFSRPSCTTLAAPILELGSMSVPSPNIRVLARVARARVPSPRDMARIPSATPESLDNTVRGPRQAPPLVEPFRLTPRLWLAPVSAKRVVCPVCARHTQKARKAHPLASRHSSNHH